MGIPSGKKLPATDDRRPHRMKSKEPIELDLEQLSALEQRLASGRLAKGDSEILQGVISAVIFLSKLLQAKNTSIKRLRKMLFGDKSEKASNVLGKSDENDAGSGKDNDQPPDDTTGTGSGTDKRPDKKQKKRKGHGRKGADAYIGADREKISHQSLCHGDPCPLCPKGKVYRQKDQGLTVRIRGVAPIQATVYECEKLRCNLCGKVFTAQMPQEAGEEKFDETSNAIIAQLKYGAGVPFYRLEKLQEALGIPLPSSTQWDQMEKTGDKIYPVYNELIRQAAQGDVVYNDDTTNRVLELIKENKTRGDDERTGIYTTGIVSTSGDIKIAIFHTGRRHAGENLQALLEKRELQKGPPIQMADALSRNIPKDLKTILANCLAHARRTFVDVTWCFPDQCRYVIEILGKVYKYDEIARTQNMSSQQRLLFHQQNSGPLMDELKSWLATQFDQKLVEPNSGLGKAIKYMRKHWGKLTLFLSVPGAPLDNNLCERALKQAIVHRKNALFYRSQFGAYIGDMFMSIIHTCSLMKVNPFDYMVALQKYSSQLIINPSRWMPWNYQDAVASFGA
jgi:transposase